MSSDTVAPGSTLTVNVPSQSGSGGSGTGSGPCAGGGPVTFDLQLLQDGVAPVQIGSATSNSSGGVDSTSVTVPSSSSLGTYVIYAQCTNSNGTTEILTSPLVLVTSGGSHVVLPRAIAPKDFTTSATYATPAMRSAIDTAVQAQVARAIAADPSNPAATGLPDGGLQLATPTLTLTSATKAGGSSRALSYGLSAAVVALMAVGLVTLRRRRNLPA